MEECRQITMFGEEIAPAQPEVLRDRNGQFLPGVSWNPGGKQKQTREEREALEAVKSLAPGVADRMTALLDDDKTPAQVKVRIMEIILERMSGPARLPGPGWRPSPPGSGWRWISRQAGSG